MIAVILCTEDEKCIFFLVFCLGLKGKGKFNRIFQQKTTTFQYSSIVAKTELSNHLKLHPRHLSDI